MDDSNIIKILDDGNPEEGTAGEGFNSLTSDEQQELLSQIQSSMLYRPVGSKHRRARELRFYHRHLSPKAKRRKKDRRQVSRASRQQNYRFAKSR